MPGRTHPLTGAINSAAIAVLALPLAGLEMIDSHTWIGLLLWGLGTTATIWIYWEDVLQIPRRTWNNWPWVGISLILLYFVPFGFVLYGKQTPEIVSCTLSDNSITVYSENSNPNAK